MAHPLEQVHGGSCDHGRVIAGEHSAEIAELELELIDGTLADLFRLRATLPRARARSSPRPAKPDAATRCSRLSREEL